MAHPMEAVIREAYAAFGRGDVDGYLSPCATGFVFHVPGNGAISGDFVGRDGLYELARRAMTLTGGSFEEEVEAVFADNTHGVVLALHRFTREGRPREYRTAHVYEIRDHQLVQCWEQPRDLRAFDDAWGEASAAAR